MGKGADRPGVRESIRVKPYATLCRFNLTYLIPPNLPMRPPERNATRTRQHQRIRVDVKARKAITNPIWRQPIVSVVDQTAPQTNAPATVPIHHACAVHVQLAPPKEQGRLIGDVAPIPVLNVQTNTVRTGQIDARSAASLVSTLLLATSRPTTTYPRLGSHQRWSTIVWAHK